MSKKKGGKKIGPITEQEIQKDAQDLIAALKTGGSEYFVASVPSLDQSGSRNVTQADFEKVAKLVHESVSNATIALVSAGLDNVAVYIARAEGNEALNATEWGNSTEVECKGDESTSYGEFPCDPQKDQYPLKLKDQIVSQLFAFLNKKGLLGDDSEDDDEVAYTFDD